MLSSFPVQCLNLRDDSLNNYAKHNLLNTSPLFNVFATKWLMFQVEVIISYSPTCCLICARELGLDLRGFRPINMMEGDTRSHRRYRCRFLCQSMPMMDE